MFRSSRRRERAHKLSLPEVSLTPLIDTTLVLLVIFMVATPVIHNSLLVEIPEGKMKEGKQSQKDITLYVDKTNALHINNKKVTMDELLKELAACIKTNGQDCAVIVKADKQSNWESVAKLIDGIKYTGGVKHVTLATQRV